MLAAPMFQIPIGPQGIDGQPHALLAIFDVVERDNPVLGQEQYILQVRCSVTVTDGRGVIEARVAEEFWPDELAAVTCFLMYRDLSEVAIRGSYGVFELKMSRNLNESVVRVSTGIRLLRTRVSSVSLATSLECVSSTNGDDAGLVRSSWTFEEPIASSEEPLSDALRILSEFI